MGPSCWQHQGTYQENERKWEAALEQAINEQAAQMTKHARTQYRRGEYNTIEDFLSVQ